MSGNEGVVYVAVQCTTDKYLNEASRSARSLRRCCPDVATAIVTDRPKAVNAKKDAHGLFDQVICVPRMNVSDRMVLSARISAFMHTPFSRTLYLDGDTQVCSNVTDMFSVLNHYDIGMVHTTHRLWRGGSDIYGEEIPDWLPEFNGGMMLYRKSEMVFRMFGDWRRLHLQMGKWNDQMALRTTLWQHMQTYALKIYALPCEYNVWIPNVQTLGMKVRIVHGRRELQRVCERINRHTNVRYWIPHPVSDLLDWSKFIRTYKGRKE